MNRKRYGEKTIKVAGTAAVTVTSKALDNDYDIVGFENKQATESGWVIVAILSPKLLTSNLPEFQFRWDHTRAELDVDILIEGKPDKGYWGKPGYSGHKTNLLGTAGRVFEADIRIPDRIVFQGTLDLSLLVGLFLTDDVSVTDSPPEIKIIDQRGMSVN